MWVSRVSLWAGLGGCVAILLGTLAQLLQPQLWPIQIYQAVAGSVGLALMGLAWLKCVSRWRAMCTLGVCCVLIALWVFALAGWRACLKAEQVLPTEWEGVRLVVEGEVVGLPQVLADGVRFRFRVDQLDDAQGRNLTPDHPLGLLWLGWYGTSLPQLRGGERWRLPVKLKAPHGHVNPHGFDFELWLWEQGMAATGYVREHADSPTAERLAAASWMGVTPWRERVREAVFQTVPAPATAGVVTALLLGDQASIERADWDVFRATGVAHLMAISGLHITGMAWLTARLVAIFWRRWPLRFRGRAPALWCATPIVSRWAGLWMAVMYAVFSGWGLPAQRTVWMLGIVQVLTLRGMRWPWPLTWVFVAAALVLLDPWAMLQAGFWLSFVAVGLLFASGDAPEGTTSPGSREASTVFERVKVAARRLWREQQLMSVCLAPLSLLLFQQVSLVGMAANLLAVPWVTLVVTPLCMLGLIWPNAWLAAAWTLQMLMPVLQLGAGLPWAQWSIAAVPSWVGAVALCGGVCMAMPWPGWWRLSGVCWCLPMLSWQPLRPAHGQFELWAADMGQGHAVLLRTQHHALLYDTGPRYSAEADAGQRVIVPLLRALDEHLDRVVLSHQDADHSGGLRRVMAMQPQADVLTSVPAEHALLQGLNSMPCRRGQHWQWDGVTFDILHPSTVPKETASASTSSPNAWSCVLRVQDARGVRALLVGDIEAAQEKALLATGDDLQADWLLVPHHGSNTSSTAAFIQAVHPQWAVVQAGYRNRYGHPHPAVMARYAQDQIAVVQTSTCGAAIWRSARAQALACEREADRRYWRR